MNLLGTFTIVCVALTAFVDAAFTLKVKAKPSQSAIHSRFDGLYLVPKLDGAHGYSSYMAAVKRDQVKYPAHLNNTQLQYIFVEDYTPVSFYETEVFNLNSHWAPAHLTLGYGTRWFKFNDQDQLIVTGKHGSNVWHGWRVCDWEYNEPQLFYDLHAPKEQKKIPGCALVNLVKEPWKE